MDEWKDIRRVARAITLAEVKKDYQSILDSLQYGNGNSNNAPSQSKVGELDTPPLKDRRSGTVLGITGTGGAGKSSVTDEIVRRYLNSFTDKTIAVVSVDPSKKKTGGALLGDRIRMNAISSPRAYMRSLATRRRAN